MYRFLSALPCLVSNDEFSGECLMDDFGHCAASVTMYLNIFLTFVDKSTVSHRLLRRSPRSGRRTMASDCSSSVASPPILLPRSRGFTTEISSQTLRDTRWTSYIRLSLLSKWYLWTSWAICMRNWSRSPYGDSRSSSSWDSDREMARCFSAIASRLSV